MTERENTTGTFSDIVLAESDYLNPSSNINETVKGGPRLERAFIQAGAGMRTQDTFWTGGGSNEFQLLFDSMLWVQSDQFATTVTTSALFDTTLNHERILAYGTHKTPMKVQPGFYASNDLTSAQIQMWTEYEVDIKSKARLADRALGFATRMSFDLSDTNVLADWAWVTTTFLVSVP